MSDENQNKNAPALGLDVIAAIGRELRRMYAEIIAEGGRNVLPRFCAGWTSQATSGRPNDADTPQAARSRPHRMAGIRSIGGGRPRRRGLLPREWMDPSASPRGVGLGMASGVLGLPVRGPRETPSVRPELSNCLICRRLVRPAPQSQPACCNDQTAANNAFAFRLRCKVPRCGDTPQPSRGNARLDTTHST